MTTTNAGIVLTAPHSIAIEAMETPAPERDQVLVRTRCSLISTGTELTLYGGEPGLGDAWRTLRDYPRSLGYSNVGIVEQVGSDVDPCWIGRRVHNHGYHQVQALAPAAKLAEVPQDVADEHACFTTLAKVAMNGLRRAGATWGEHIAIVGAGIVGQLAARLCLHLGASRVTVIEPSAHRINCLPQHTGLETIDQPLGPALGLNRQFDLVIEASGNPDVMQGLPDLLRDQGRILLLSSPRGPSRFDFHDGCNRRSLTIIGAHSFSHPIDSRSGNPWTSARHARLFLELLQQGVLSVQPLISRKVHYTNAADAYRLLDERREQTMAVLFSW
ncbi:MAG: zinc-binding dehydrogenase [Wenzhouxiangellaceae bacterium]